MVYWEEKEMFGMFKKGADAKGDGYDPDKVTVIMKVE